jgi:hypothetical protein
MDDSNGPLKRKQKIASDEKAQPIAEAQYDRRISNFLRVNTLGATASVTGKTTTVCLPFLRIPLKCDPDTRKGARLALCVPSLDMLAGKEPPSVFAEFGAGLLLPGDEIAIWIVTPDSSCIVQDWIVPTTLFDDGLLPLPHRSRWQEMVHRFLGGRRAPGLVHVGGVDRVHMGDANRVSRPVRMGDADPITVVAWEDHEAMHESMDWTKALDRLGLRWYELFVLQTAPQWTRNTPKPAPLGTFCIPVQRKPTPTGPLEGIATKSTDLNHTILTRCLSRASVRVEVECNGIGSSTMTVSQVATVDELLGNGVPGIIIAWKTGALEGSLRFTVRSHLKDKETTIFTKYHGEGFVVECPRSSGPLLRQYASKEAES